MLAEWKATRFKVEVGLLLALCLFLPLLEAPKNLAWLAYAAAWLANRVRARDFGGRWDGWDTLFAAWIASGFVVAAATQFGEIRGGEWGGALDLLRYGSVAWLVKRGGYGARERRWMLGVLVLSTLAALAVGYVRLWSGVGKSGTLQLYSVGHVNHSAIYLAIVLGICAAWVFDAYGRWSQAARLAGLAVFAILLFSLVVMASRAAAAAGFAFLLVLGLAWWRRSRVPLLAMLGAVCVLIVGAALLRADLVEKQALYESRGQPLSHRDTAWRTGLEAWARHPWFGIGMDNFPQLSAARVGAWRRESGREAAPFEFFPHAHSLYVNTLAERGVLGFAALLAVLGAWLGTLVRARPAPHRRTDWLLWGAAASGLFVTAVAGLLNTTLHHEHGILAALLLGLWAGRSEASPAS